MSPRQIRSEVFLREDIQSILRAIDAANSEFAARFPQEAAASYRAGFSDALQAVATAFHASLASGDWVDDYGAREARLRSGRIRILDHVPSSRPLDRGSS